MSDLIKPTPFKTTNMDGGEVNVILSRFNAVEGREILAKYPLSALPKIGDYAVSEETMFKLMKHVAVEKDGVEIRLSTPSLIHNHTHDAETLLKIEMAMLEYNCSFFGQGKISDFLGEFIQMMLAKISSISIPSSEPSSAPVQPHSTSSAPSTT